MNYRNDFVRFIVQRREMFMFLAMAIACFELAIVAAQCEEDSRQRVEYVLNGLPQLRRFEDRARHQTVTNGDLYYAKRDTSSIWHGSKSTKFEAFSANSQCCLFLFPTKQ